MNKDKLMGLIRTHGDTQAKLAEDMGICTSSFNAKVNNKGEFKHSEIAFIAKRYGLSSDELCGIFFAE